MLAGEYIKEALETLSSIKNSTLTEEERKTKAIELASLIMRAANLCLKKSERNKMLTLQKSLENLNIKAFIFDSIDTVFRSKNNKTTAKYHAKLINFYGIPEAFSFVNRFKIYLFVICNKIFYNLFSYCKKTIIKNYSNFYVPEENKSLEKFLNKKKEKNLPVNIAYINEQALGKIAVEQQINKYVNYLSNPLIDYISIKISYITSSIKVNAEDSSINEICDSLRKIYRQALKDPENPKFVNIDMENYKYFALTIASFKKILEEKEFFNFYAGITLQSYLPNSYSMQVNLTKWAQKRIQDGGAPIKINLVKGAYLSYEAVKASIKGWPQAPFLEKISTDANYKKMLAFGLLQENIKAVHISVCTHNVLDIAYALVLRAENSLDEYVDFQMFENRTPHIQSIIHKLIKNKLRIYTPTYLKNEINNIIYFVQRRLEEHLHDECFLKYVLNLYPGGENWEILESIFSQSLEKIIDLSSATRRTIGKKSVPITSGIYEAFENEPDTDFTLPSKRKGQEEIINKYHDFKPEKIPLVIGGKEIFSEKTNQNTSPSYPSKPLYSYSLASNDHIELAIKTAKENEYKWANIPLSKRKEIIEKAATLYCKKRADFVGIMMLDSAKIIFDADCEISESIDIMEYYLTRISKLTKINDVTISPKGTMFVASARAFPYSSPIGKIVAALLTGNCVIFKPPPDTVLTGWYLVNALWEAGIPKEVLQFVNCSDETAQDTFLKDKRISILLSGKTKTIEKFVHLNPFIDLSASSEGKNTFIISAISDRRLAIKNLIESAFAFSGQQYSSVSLAILDKELYDDPIFLKKLLDAAENLKVGSIWNPETDIGPLLLPPDEILLKELTALENNEKWLLKPKKDPDNSLLWSPGIKLGITQESSFFNNFLPGPLLGLIRAEDFNQALEIANKTKYGLCASLQSLDREELLTWKNSIEVGNLFINNVTTKIVIRRQPFGGCKKSFYGKGFKSGGPNYLFECIIPRQKNLPKEKKPVNEKVNALTSIIEKIDLSAEELGLWYASIANYSFWWSKLCSFRDPTKIIGQDNYFGYVPLNSFTLRITPNSYPLDILRICAAALTCQTPFEVSFDSSNSNNWKELNTLVPIIDETDDEFFIKITKDKIKRIRMATKPCEKLKIAAAKTLCYIDDSPVLANGRFELLNYLREVAISYDYHRYGNLGSREGELRKPSV